MTKPLLGVMMIMPVTSVTAAAPAAPAFTVEKQADAVVIRAADKEVLRYQLRRPEGASLPVESGGYFHPFATPAGTVVTDVSPPDHPHHRGIFLAWLEMHGKKDADFWGWGEHAPKNSRAIVNTGVSALAGGKQGGFRATNDWLAEGAVMVHEDLRASVSRDGPAHVLDLVYTLTPTEDIRLARWAFGGLALRTRKDGEAQAVGAGGAVTLPVPKHTEPTSDWPAAPWYGFNLKLPDGATVGAAVLDHPKNPPSPWHVVSGIRLLNPCITAPGEVVLKAKKPLVLRYRVVVQDGPLAADVMGRLASDWAKKR